MKKSILGIFAACLTLNVLSAAVYADCMSVLAVVRHGEDFQKSGEPETLNEYGWAHAAAYGHLFKLYAATDTFPRLNNLMENQNICPFTRIISYYTTKPKQTAEAIRDNLGLDSFEAWGSDNAPFIKIPKLTPGVSTILILNRQSLWGNGGKPDGGTFLDKVISYGPERDKIISAGSPMFNYLYIFTNQKNDGTFGSGYIFAQKYSYSGKTNQCNVRLHDGSVKNPIIISDLKTMSTNGIFQAPISWACTTE